MEALSIIGDLGLNVIDDEEIEKCRKLFHMYDEDKDGKLTPAEFATTAPKRSPKPKCKC